MKKLVNTYILDLSKGFRAKNLQKLFTISLGLFKASFVGLLLFVTYLHILACIQTPVR